MKIVLSNNEKLALFTPLLSFLLIYSSIILVAQYGATPLSQLATQDPLEVGDVEMLGNGEYKVNILSENQTVLVINTPYNVGRGDSVAVVNVQDSVSIPFLYEPRSWTDVYVGEKMVVSGETYFLSYFAGALWILPLGGLVGFKLFNRKDKKI